MQGSMSNVIRRLGTAVARKIARHICSIISKRPVYFEERYRQRVLHNISICTQQLGIAPEIVEPIANLG